MSPTPTPEGAQTPPPPISPAGTYTIHNVTVGCKIFIRRPGPDGDTEERLAEILSIRDKPSNPYLRRSQRSGESAAPAAADGKPEDNWEFFVHWDQFNKRLDDWVAGSRLVLTKDLVHPRPKSSSPAKKHGTAKKTAPPGKVPRNQNLLKKATSNAAANHKSHSPSPATLASPSPAPQLGKRHSGDEQEESLDDDADGETDADGDSVMEAEETFAMDIDVPTPQEPLPVAAFSKEKEIEKLRTSGSMTQSISEIARVKNLNRLQMGKYEVDSWYFSPYPQEYAHLPILYICEFCLSYFPSPFMFSRHRTRCTLSHPPGNEIYRHEDISFFEIDGKRQLTWCRNLSLLSKCFLDHKTLYYDVTPFMYYVMAQRDSAGCHIIGYFSKEKESAEGYNVACILTLPQHQRHGFGKLLIEFSYELSKKENKLGSPEKPLSDLGLLGYRAYWTETIVDFLLSNPDTEVSVEEISNRTAITQADVMNTCAIYQMFKHYKGQHLICLNSNVMERHAKFKAKQRRRIRPECLNWKPIQWKADQLRFGF